MRWLESDWDGRVEDGSSELMENYINMPRKELELRSWVRSQPTREHERFSNRLQREQKKIVKEGVKASKNSPRRHVLRKIWKNLEEARRWIDENPDLSHNALDCCPDPNGNASLYHWDPTKSYSDVPFYLSPRHNVNQVKVEDSIKRAKPLVDSLRKGGFKSRYWLYQAVKKANLAVEESVALWRLWNKIHG